MRPKSRSIPSPPPLERQDAAMDTNPDEEESPMEEVMAVKQEPETTPTNKKIKKRNYDEWYAHVNKVKAENPGITHDAAVRKAKETYIKTPKAKRDTSGYKPNPWLSHINDWMEKNPNWKDGYSYKDVLKKCKETYKKGQ